MRIVYAEKLDRVSHDIKQLAHEMQSAIKKAGVALFTSDKKLSQTIIDHDRDLDALEVSVINQCMTLLAQQAPVGTDLRMIVSNIQFASFFERMGDLARHISEAVIRSFPESAIPKQSYTVLQEMRVLVEEIVDCLCMMLDERDISIASTIFEKNVVLSALHKKTYDLATDSSWLGTSQDVINLVLLSRYYERFGDHAVATAQRMIYIVSGFNPTQMPELTDQD